MVTIYDVAKVANVSPKTVSRVLNNDVPVGKETRSKVETAIAELGYVRSNAARMMRSTKSGIIGLITNAFTLNNDIADIKGLPDILIVQAIQSVIAKSSMQLMVTDTGSCFKNVPGIINTFLEHRVEGLLYVSGNFKKVSLPKTPIDLPIVLANCFDDENTPAIIPDNKINQFKLVNQIIEDGHSRIAFITLSKHHLSSQLRVQGYKQAHKDAGLEIDDALIYTGQDVDIERDTTALWTAIETLLKLPNPPTVICCGNDRMAGRVYKLLRGSAYKIPQQISVAGHDNHRIVAETLDPPLSTVELAYHEIGIRAADQLLSRINGEASQPVNPVRVSGSLAWRESVSTTQSSIN